MSGSGDYKDVIKQPEIPLFHLQGIAACGTPAYSNQDPKDPKDNVNRFARDGWMGVMGQCVCFARKTLWNRFGLILPDVPVAAQIFYIPHVFDQNLNKVPVKAIRNGTTEKPVKDSFIIYASHFYFFGIGAPKSAKENGDDSPGNFPGHIGWITDVKQDESGQDRVYVADQNRYFHDWKGKDYSASFPLRYNEKNKTWTIEDEGEPVVGWVTFPTAGKPDFSRYEKSLTNTPKIFPAKQEDRDKVDWANRPIDQKILDNFPSYDGAFQRKSWFNVMLDFRPHPLLFIPVFASMIFRFFVLWPIKRFLGW